MGLPLALLSTVDCVQTLVSISLRLRPSAISVPCAAHACATLYPAYLSPCPSDLRRSTQCSTRWPRPPLCCPPRTCTTRPVSPRSRLCLRGDGTGWRCGRGAAGEGLARGVGLGGHERGRIGGMEHTSRHPPPKGALHTLSPSSVHRQCCRWSGWGSQKGEHRLSSLVDIR